MIPIMETKNEEKKGGPTDLLLVEELTASIDTDLLEAIRGYDLKAARSIQNDVAKLAEVVAEAIEDIQLHLGEHRAKVLSIVFSRMPGVFHIEWRDNNNIRIHSMFPIDDSVLVGINFDLNKKLYDLDLQKIMDEPKLLNTNSSVLSWRWVG